MGSEKPKVKVNGKDYMITKSGIEIYREDNKTYNIILKDKKTGTKHKIGKSATISRKKRNKSPLMLYVKEQNKDSGAVTYSIEHVNGVLVDNKNVKMGGGTIEKDTSFIVGGNEESGVKIDVVFDN